MKGNPKVIEHLNKILGNELIAINQYFLHARMLKNWGYFSLADKVYHESIDEMKHADELVTRILFLEGLPNLQYLGKINIGETCTEIFDADLQLEYKAIEDLRQGITLAESLHDFTSQEILAKILASEEEHILWLETQLKLIKQIGEKSYLQTKLD